MKSGCRSSLKLISGILLYLVLQFNSLNAQVSAIVVDAGPDVSASCNNPCVTLNASFVNTFETTSYLVWPTTYTPYSFTQGNQIFVNVDDIWTNTINLPFDFCFFGVNYDKVVIGANGIISFNTSYAGGFCPWGLQGAPASNPIPNPSLPLNAIMGIYQDIDPTNMGQVYYLLTGTFPNRRLIVSYYQVPYFGDPNSVGTGSCPNPLFATMQIVLHETTNVIDMYVQDKPFCPGWNGGRAIQGIQNATGTVAYSIPGRNNQQFSLTNDAVLFVPFGSLETSVRWLENGNQIAATGQVVVCPVAPTSYVLEVTYATCSGNNVVITDTVVVSPASAASGPNINITQQVSCSSPNSGSLTVVPSSGTAPFSYLWSNGATTATVGGLSAGTYTVTVTESGGCVTMSSLTLVAPNGITLTPGLQNNVNCYGGLDGSLTVTVSGGQTPYTYLWSNGATTQTASNLSAGTYTITATDQNSCTATWTSTITEPTELTLSVPVVNSVSCFGGNDGDASINVIGGTIPYSYLWSSGSVIASSSNLTAGTYTVTVTDNRGCTEQTTATITSPAQIQVNHVSTTNVSCGGWNDGSLSVNTTGGTGALQYVWSPAGGTSATAPSLPAGTYSVVVTDQNSCTASLTGLNVTQPQTMQVSSTVQDVLCNGGNTGSINIAVSLGTAPYLYTWSNGATTTSISNLISNIYSVTVTDQNSCTIIYSVPVNQPAALSISNVNITPASCNGFSNGAVTINVIGGTTPYNYTWSPSVSTSATASNLSAGAYDFQVTDQNGCITAGSATVTQPIAVNAVVLTQKNVSCFGGNDGFLSLSTGGGTSPYTYLWSPSGGNAAIAQNLSAGLYSVQVTDNAGCTFQLGNLNVTEPAAITSQIQITNASCFQGTDGSLSIQTQGGTSPYVYLWSNSSTNATISNLNPGNYTVTVTDNAGCIYITSQNITSPSAISIVNSTTPSSCNGANGSALTTVSGGTIPYSYLWSTGTSTAQLQNVLAGTYTIVVTDDNGCTETAQATIAALPLPTVNISGKPDICELESTPLTALTQNAVAPVSYSWSPGNGSTQVFNVNPTSNQQYSLVITDANNCTATASHFMTVHPAPMITITDPDQESCLPFSFTFNATVDIPNSTYLWDFGDLNTSTQQIPTHAWKSAGLFDVSLEATSPIGCKNKVTRPGMIWIHPFPEADFTQRPDILYDYQPIAFFQNTSSDAINYWWDFGDGSPIETTYSPQHLYSDTGIYKVSLVAESEYGCRDTAFGAVRYLLQSNIYVPMAFTPNDDGKNDEFLVSATELANFHMVIQNRWGQTVFSTDDQSFAWDGRMSGAECPNGVYVYLIKYKSTNGKSGELSGRITLLR